MCLSCRGPGPSLCAECSRSFRRGGETRTPAGLVVHSWALHEGAARTLVRRLKYEGVTAVAHLVARDLCDRVPADATALVPVARTIVRRVRYGVDPALVLARALAENCELPVIGALIPPLWGRPNAGSLRDERRPPRFRAGFRTERAVLVDDVLTTGVTLDAAASILGQTGVALTITGVP